MQFVNYTNGDVRINYTEIMMIPVDSNKRVDYRLMQDEIEVGIFPSLSDVKKEAQVIFEESV